MHLQSLLKLSIVVMYGTIFADLIGATEYVDPPYVMEKNESRSLSILKYNLKNDAFNQYEINKVIFNAAGCGYYAMVKFLMDLPEDALRPDQCGINWALAEAVRNDYREMIRMMVNRPLGKGKLGPDQYGINAALCKATRNGNASLIEFFLDGPYIQLHPDQLGMQWSVSVAALYGCSTQLKWFINRPEGRLRPTREDINRALSLAAGEGFSLIVEYLLNLTNLQIKPDQGAMIKAYRAAAKAGKDSVVALLSPYVPTKVRQVLLPPRAVMPVSRLGCAIEICGFSEAVAKDNLLLMRDRPK